MAKAFDYIQVPVSVVATDLTGASVEVEGAYFRAARLIAVNGPMKLDDIRRKVGTHVDVEHALNHRSTDAEPLLSFRWLEEWRERANAARDRMSKAGTVSAEKRAKKKRKLNTRSTYVEHTSNDSSTNVEHATILSSTIRESISVEERAPETGTHFTGSPFTSTEAVAAWLGFEAMRKRKGKPMTDRARELIIADLRKMGEADAIKSLNASTRAGWTDVYPPKAGPAKPEHSAQRQDLKTSW